MTRIALVVSDVDGTLLTKDKTLTEGAKAAAARLHAANIGFTIVSSRPTIGMRFLIEPLGIRLPVGPFNGSSIVDPNMNPVEQHLIPASAVQKSLELPDSAVEVSRRSLAEAGNLSSVSVLHILEQVAAGGRPPPGSPGLMIGLGPGVSVELVLLRW